MHCQYYYPAAKLVILPLTECIGAERIAAMGHNLPLSAAKETKKRDNERRTAENA
jgi:hypothetical protein